MGMDDCILNKKPNNHNNLEKLMAANQYSHYSLLFTNVQVGGGTHNIPSD
jgi:hypothetical protein